MSSVDSGSVKKSLKKALKEYLQGVFLDAETLGIGHLDTSTLDALPCRLTQYDNSTGEEIVTRIKTAHVVLVNKVILDASVLQQAENLLYIGVTATGMNNIYLDYCKSNNIRVQNVEGYGTDSVVQHTLTLLLNLATNFARYQRDVANGEWSASPHFCLSTYQVTELAGKHAVIVGHGALGQRVEALLTALGMKVSIAARPGKKDDSRPSLASLLPSADVLTLHCPLTAENEKLINGHTLSLMRPSCLLINTARGGLVDEEALLIALNNNQIGGAGLDVLGKEPPPEDHPLLNANHPNLLITPHNAWIATASRQRLLDLTVNHLSHFLHAHSGVNT